MDYSYLEDNVRGIRDRMEAAAKSAGRADNATLLAAVKSGSIEEINYLHRVCGVNDIGENRVQQLLERYDKLDREDLNLHFIGHLQTNKVKYIIDKVCMIHSLDSEKLAAEIDKEARKHGVVMKVLVEVNSGEEENKSGVAPDEAVAFCASLAKYPNLDFCGLMTMAPNCENKADYLRYFGRISQLAEDIKGMVKAGKPILSMGMSGSFEEAIMCGATVVRVGRDLFRK